MCSIVPSSRSNHIVRTEQHLAVHARLLVAKDARSRSPTVGLITALHQAVGVGGEHRAPAGSWRPCRRVALVDQRQVSASPVRRLLAGVARQRHQHRTDHQTSNRKRNPGGAGHLMGSSEPSRIFLSDSTGPRRLEPMRLSFAAMLLAELVETSAKVKAHALAPGEARSAGRDASRACRPTWWRSASRICRASCPRARWASATPACASCGSCRAAEAPSLDLREVHADAGRGEGGGGRRLGRAAHAPAGRAAGPGDRGRAGVPAAPADRGAAPGRPRRAW